MNVNFGAFLVGFGGWTVSDAGFGQGINFNLRNQASDGFGGLCFDPVDG